MTTGGQGPIFIVGCGRSGTTVLYEVLSEHPDVAWISNYTQRFGVEQLAALSRLRFLGRPPKQGRRRWRPHPVEGHSVWDRCSGELVGGTNRPLDASDLTPEARDRTQAMARHHVRYQGAARFLNKNTRHTRRIPYLHAIFPDAVFVHIVRDPRPTSRSLTQVAFWDDMPVWWEGDRRAADLATPTRAPIAVAAEFWAREVTQVESDRAVLSPGQFHELRFEDLVADPDAVIGAVLAAVGLSPHPKVEAAYARLRQARADAFRTELDRDALKAVQAFAADEAERYGYDVFG